MLSSATSPGWGNSGAARSGGNVGQSEYVFADPVMADQAERGAGGGELGGAAAKHHRMQVDAILIDQAKVGEAVRQRGAGNFDLAVALGLQLADLAVEIAVDQRGVGADRR